MKFRAERKTCWIDWRRTTCLATVHGPTGRLLCSGNGLRTEESPSRRSFGFERLAPHIAGAQERTRNSRDLSREFKGLERRASFLPAGLPADDGLLDCMFLVEPPRVTRTHPRQFAHVRPSAFSWA